MPQFAEHVVFNITRFYHHHHFLLYTFVVLMRCLWFVGCLDCLPLWEITTLKRYQTSQEVILILMMKRSRKSHSMRKISSRRPSILTEGTVWATYSYSLKEKAIVIQAISLVHSIKLKRWNEVFPFLMSYNYNRLCTFQSFFRYIYVINLRNSTVNDLIV